MEDQISLNHVLAVCPAREADYGRELAVLDNCGTRLE
jgi:hypothetical protein